ncbi:MAG: hypothetical protein CMJ18_12155 [Phycisphaeraceae bacterium]|nr:hypothetical protein [Phycisphaeraceae bacterium]
MADQTRPHVLCPKCERRYRWKDEYRKRKVRCITCKSIILMPSAPSGRATLADVGTIPLDEPDEKTPARDPDKTASCPSCNAPMKPGAVICINCGFNVQQGKKLETAIDAAEGGGGKAPAEPKPGDTSDIGVLGKLGASSRVQKDLRNRLHDHDAKLGDWIVPAIVLGIGFVLVVLDVAVLFDAKGHAAQFSPVVGLGQNPNPPPPTFAEILAQRVAKLVGNSIFFGMLVPFHVLGLFAVARTFGSSFSPLLSAVLKAVAVALAVVAVTGCVDSVLYRITEGLPLMGMDMYLKYPVIIAVFGGLSMPMLDLDLTEALLYGAVALLGPILMVIVFAILGFTILM